MSKMREQQRSLFARCIVMVCLLSAACPFAFALDPKLDVSQYAHTAWRIREGFTKSRINAIAQTTDGYLWLGTDLGLLRFDGVRIVPWQPPNGQQLPANHILKLAASRDGTLWIGTTNGLASWRNGQLTQYAELAGRFIFAILEDRDASVWVSGMQFPNGRLCAIQNGNAHCYGDDGSLGPAVLGLYEDHKGNLWAGVKDGLWRWKPGRSDFFPMPGMIDSIHSFAEADDGTLLLTTRSGIARLVNGKIEPYLIPGITQPVNVQRMMRDRDGDLWIATSHDGVVHVHHDRTDVFKQSNGLTGDYTLALLEDRESNIWILTTSGLDRFHELAVTTLPTDQSGLNSEVWSVLTATDGSVWLSTARGLLRWNNGHITPFGSTRGKSTSESDGKLNGDTPNSLFQDSRGRIWASTFHGFGYLQDDRFVSLAGLPGGAVHSIAEDNTGNLWVANQDHGLFRISPRGEVQQIPWAGLGQKGFAYSLIGDPGRGGIWLGFFRGGVAYFSDGTIRESYGSSQGLPEGEVQTFRFDQSGTLWMATGGGLSRFKNGRFSTLTSKNGLPCDRVHWMMEDEEHSVWLDTACGLAKVTRSEFDAWVAAADKEQDTKQKIHVTVFDGSDGAVIRSFPPGFRPLVGKSLDGRFWFTGQDSVDILDPRHIPLNNLPPLVHVEQITTDHRAHDLPSDGKGQLRLPPRIRDVQIDYTALSLVAPEKVLFRYKLEGWDHDWQDVGTRRQAFYGNLPPRAYTFRVMACNNSGVWNEAGAFLNFSVAPAYYQTIWFRALCVVVFLGLVAALYESRLKQVARRFNLRMEERVNERTRVARDLHDTLLQSFQGVLLKFHAITYLLPDRPDEAQKNLEAVIEQAREAITEGRDAVHGLRSSALGTTDLASTITALGNELAGVQNEQSRPEFGLQVEGSPRNLAPFLGDEVYRLTAEALRNAFKHANARRIEVEIRYDRRQFRLRVRDNGKGIESNIVGGVGRAGHFGLPGMHERAKLAGGKLSVWSKVASGTEVELTIPAGVAYAKSPAARRPMFFRRGA